MVQSTKGEESLMSPTYASRSFTTFALERVRRYIENNTVRSRLVAKARRLPLFQRERRLESRRGRLKAQCR
jgi:hypothetical protein